jgi:GNAT superfamily N-acetyltransferase
MTNELAVRDAGPADAKAIAGLLGELGYRTDREEIPERLSTIHREGGAAVLAVDADGSALGLMCLASFAALHVAGRTGYITTVVTSSAARRRGVGRALVDYAKQWARSRGCVRLSVTSAEHRADAHSFYPACGLPYTGRRFATAITE